MGNHINQLNVSYIKAEDRILLRLNTTQREEFRIWLTRRLLRKLARELGGAERRLLGLESSEGGFLPGARAIQEFKREASTAGVDFGERFEESPSGLPFGEAPVLATDCEVRPQEGVAAIGLSLANQRVLNFVLDVNGIHGTVAMLQKAVAHSDWDLGQELDAESRPTAGQAGLH